MEKLSTKTTKEKIFRITACSALYLLFALFLVWLFTFNSDYHKIYSCPEVVNARADFSDVCISGRDVACNLSGEWEFYYDKWIVTDGYDGEPDGLIKLPSLWTYKNYGGKVLPKTGYASYKITVFNVRANENVIVFRNNENFAYRSFINGKLNYRRGELSKELSETKVSTTTDEVHPYTTDGGPLEIVIELSATDTAGLNLVPWLEHVDGSKGYGTNLRMFAYFALGFSLCSVLLSILSFLFFSFKRDWTTPVFMSVLFLHLIASKDMMYVFKMDFDLSGILRYASALSALAVFIIHLIKNKTRTGKVYLFLTFVSTAVLGTLTAVFYGTPLSPVFAIILFAIYLGYVYFITVKSSFSYLQTICYGILYLLLLSVFWFELCDFLGLLVFGTEFIFCIHLMIMLICFSVLWLYKISVASREIIRVNDLEKQLAVEKSQTLKAQIKPHFIYNCLTAIQYCYQKSTDEGNNAVERFARHLRLVTDSDKLESIPFEEEIDNVLNYFELERLRHGDVINILLDLDYTDFKVPALSLQPLVENAVKHGIKNDEGYVQITSYRQNDVAVVTVQDNGEGFDTSAQSDGVGLKNVKNRFSLYGCEFKIESSESGTIATITIPLE